jgi:excisionase family DNA binding protein
MSKAPDRQVAQLLTVAQVAELLGTSERFPRRLIAERRIEFVKIGRYVRISEAAVADFIEAGRIEPMTGAGVRSRMRGAA